VECQKQVYVVVDGSQETRWVNLYVKTDAGHKADILNEHCDKTNKPSPNICQQPPSCGDTVSISDAEASKRFGGFTLGVAMAGQLLF
jgi:hypothetical protein